METLPASAAPRSPGPASGTSSAAIASGLHMRPTILRAASLPGRFEDFARGVLPRRAGQPVAGMGAGPAKIEAVDRRRVIGPAEGRAHGEELIERQFAMINVAAAEAVDLLEVERRDDLPLLDEPGNPWRVRLQRSQHDIGEHLPLHLPGIRSELV